MSGHLSVQVLFNLANQYAANDMDNEALSTYNAIIKTKDFTNPGELCRNIDIFHFDYFFSFHVIVYLFHFLYSACLQTTLLVQLLQLVKCVYVYVCMYVSLQTGLVSLGRQPV